MCFAKGFDQFVGLSGFVITGKLWLVVSLKIRMEGRVANRGLFGRCQKMRALPQLKLLRQTIQTLSDGVDNGRVGKKTLELFWWQVFEQEGQNGGQIGMR